MYGGVRSAVAFGLCMLASGCVNRTTAPPLPSLASFLPGGGKEILPNATARVGHLYFPGTGRRPVFALADGTIYNEVCYDDYALTDELKRIGEHVIDDGVLVTKGTFSQGVSADVSAQGIASLSGLAVSADFSRKRTFVVENARKLSLTDAGEQLIRARIGDNCRREIAGLARQGRNVILVLSGVRADRITDTTDLSASAGVDVAGQVGGGAAGSSNALAQYDLIFVSISPTAFDGAGPS